MVNDRYDQRLRLLLSEGLLGVFLLGVELGDSLLLVA